MERIEALAQDRTEEDIAKRALKWNPKGHQKRGKSNETWIQTTLKKSKQEEGRRDNCKGMKWNPEGQIGTFFFKKENNGVSHGDN